METLAELFQKDEGKQATAVLVGSGPMAGDLTVSGKLIKVASDGYVLEESANAAAFEKSGKNKKYGVPKENILYFVVEES